jgi:ABC-type nickel/cobalt efflux system permease component RcnA
MTSILLFGFLLGMQHAMEADHVAAVASLAARKSSMKATIRLGTVWGIGHTLTLLLVGAGVLALNTLVPDKIALGLEFAVGLMLVILGLDVLRRLWRKRIHFHSHRHGDRVHFHAHSHSGGRAHKDDPHEHEHADGLPLRSLLEGMMHGLAGSAALIVLALEMVRSFWQGIIYILIFGMGSIIGMAALTLVIGIPFRYSARSMTWAYNGLQAAVGLATFALGVWVMYEIGWMQGLFA